MEDLSIKKPIGVLYDVFVKFDKFIFLTDLIALYCVTNHEVPTNLGRLCLATKRVLVNVEYGEMKFWVNNEEVTFNVCNSMKQPMYF